MTKHIAGTTLRDWLDEGRPVTVVDVRSADARSEWSIPGSIHVDAYAELQQGSPGPFATEHFAPDKPIVTVCNAGDATATGAVLHLPAQQRVACDFTPLANGDRITVGDATLTVLSPPRSYDGERFVCSRKGGGV